MMLFPYQFFTQRLPKLVAVSLMILLFTTMPTNIQADGVIIPDPICFRCPVPPPPPPEVPYLTVQSHQVQVTIDQQVATTRVDQIFRNDSDWALQGTYIFPLPETAAIGEFSMWIEGEKVEGTLYTKEEARRIYDDIVRKRLDPALLEYVGRDLFQASIFPIEPGDTRRVVLEYSQILPIDNGLVQYTYPLSTEKFSAKPLEDVSVTIEIKSPQPIKSIYAASHAVSIDRPNELTALAGWEAKQILPDKDFTLYYTVSPDDVGLNLLSYKNSNEDGFFTLLIAPSVEAAEIIAKDVLLVVDTSGSMEGAKLAQAQDALAFVLDHLHTEDRFNIISFSTGVRSFASRLQDIQAIDEAKAFVEQLRAEGSTDINRALLDAISTLNGDSDRPVIIIFLTDGLPTSGITEPDLIINNVSQAAPKQVRIFPFGVGDDVDTFLLDTLAREQRGITAYVRPTQLIDEAVSSFYAKVSTPVLADVDLTIDGVPISDTYPFPLPDIFAGTQLTVVGRYAQSGAADVVLSGTVNGETQSFSYPNLTFSEQTNHDFIPRLWATRKIGHLLNDIRLLGENKEAIDQIVKLSLRYGIITPYTSFLVEEPTDTLSVLGREEIAERARQNLYSTQKQSNTGGAAVDAAVANSSLEQADMAAPLPSVSTSNESLHSDSNPLVKTSGDKAFIWQDNTWVDTAYDPASMKPIQMHFASTTLFNFLADNPTAAKYFALGQAVIVVIDNQAYEMLPADSTIIASETATSEVPEPGHMTSKSIIYEQWCTIMKLVGLPCE